MKFTLNWLSCQKIIGINKFKKAKAKAKKYVGGNNFTLISVSTVFEGQERSTETKLLLPQTWPVWDTLFQPLIPPAQNQYMQEKILGELIFARIHAGPVFALARIQENMFEEVVPEYFAKFLGEFTQCEYMPRLYLHLREYRKYSWRIIHVLVSCQGAFAVLPIFRLAQGMGHVSLSRRAQNRRVGCGHTVLLRKSLWFFRSSRATPAPHTHKANI